MPSSSGVLPTVSNPVPLYRMSAMLTPAMALSLSNIFAGCAHGVLLGRIGANWDFSPTFLDTDFVNAPPLVPRQGMPFAGTAAAE